MANKVTTISDLLQRVASSCLTHRLPAGHAFEDCDCDCEEGGGDRDEKTKVKTKEEKEEDEEEHGLRIWEEDGPPASATPGASHKARIREMECFMHEVFDAVSSVKRAYVGLQKAHSPWDPDNMRVADASVVAEFRKLGRLRDRFRRECFSPSSAAAGQTAAPLRDAVAPYEAAIDDLKRQLKAKEAENENLKEKLRSAGLGSSGRRGRLHSGKRVGCVAVLGTSGTPTPELFEAHMERVKSASKSFTAHLLSLMRSARWDISAAVRSVIEGGGGDGAEDRPPAIPNFEPRHAKYALEAYVNRKVFQGFENETFYLEGSLSSLINPAEFRRDCFAQFRDMRGMEPEQLLGILPGCPFGRFAAAKYLAIVHAKMEESLFGGGAEQRRQVLAGNHPRTGFYGEYLRLAKAVWLLHLLAFAIDPAPAHFEASRGAEFQPHYMESVLRFAGGRVPAGSVVGFPVAPGFRFGDGSVVRARVYLVPRTHASASVM
ncbi:IRK-interacting protein-like [Canna indica]|uniref:IRK-interacting protein-like n=1 Tax=Canna indica TaxID=4628 RepID=A0AAQ3QA65_9LILI|nr:IRK-interacting protein-like [Canna indica]